MEPGPVDEPANVHVSTLIAHKRSLSYYMPRREEKWDGRRGNPTTSKSVNKLIQVVETLQSKNCSVTDISNPSAPY